MKIYSLYNDGTGNHLQCYLTEEEAWHDLTDRGYRYLNVQEEEYKPGCDCGFVLSQDK